MTLRAPELTWAPGFVGLTVDEALSIALSCQIMLVASDGSDVLRRFGVVVGQKPHPGEDLLSESEPVIVTISDDRGEAGVREPLEPRPPAGRLSEAVNVGND